MTIQQQAVQAVQVWLSDVEEAPWNVNTMSPEKYQDLVRDMKNAGPEGTDPIDTASALISGSTAALPGFKRITIDGAHRVRAAKKLGWKYLYEFHHPEVRTEEQARLFNYKRDADRGEIDQFKLAASFKWFTEKGFKQQEIADKFGVDKTTVSKRLTLLNLAPTVIEHLTEKIGLTVSHLEPIATLDKPQQIAVAKQLTDSAWGRAQTVKDVEREVRRVRELSEREKRWKDALAKAKFPKCPQCQRDPVIDSYYVPPSGHCDRGHHWNINSGKDPDANRVWSDPDQKMLSKSDANLPQHVKTTHRTGEFARAQWKFVQELWPQIKKAASLSIDGELKNGQGFTVRIEDFDESGTQFEYEEDHGKNKQSFYTADIDSKTYTDKGLYTRVTGLTGRVTKKTQLEELEQKFEKFLSEYGAKPRGNSR